MVVEQPFDITALPELSRLADEVRRTRRPRVLRRADEDIALLLPLPETIARRSPRRKATGSVVASTAGALRGDIPFPGIAAEKCAFEEAVAEDVRRRMGE